MIPGISALNHVTIRTADIERMVRFYTDVLGFRELYRLLKDDGGLRLVYLMVSQTQFIELFPTRTIRPAQGTMPVASIISPSKSPMSNSHWPKPSGWECRSCSR